MPQPNPLPYHSRFHASFAFLCSAGEIWKVHEPSPSTRYRCALFSVHHCIVLVLVSQRLLTTYGLAVHCRVWAVVSAQTQTPAHRTTLDQDPSPHCLSTSRIGT